MSEFELPEMDDQGNIKLSTTPKTGKSGLKKFPASSGAKPDVTPAPVSQTTTTKSLETFSLDEPDTPAKTVAPPANTFGLPPKSAVTAPPAPSKPAVTATVPPAKTVSPLDTPVPVHSADHSDVDGTQVCNVTPLLDVPPLGAFPDQGTDDEKKEYLKNHEFNRIAHVLNSRRRVPSQVKLHKPIPKEFVLPGLRKGDLGMIAAPGATGKTFLVLSLALGLAGVRPDFLGRPMETTGKVVFLAGEDDENILDLRTWYMLPPDAVEGKYDDNFVPIPLSGEVPYLVEKSKGKLVRGEWYEPIRKLAMGTTLLVIDPLRRFHEADENDSQHMTFVVQTMEAIAKETGCAIIFTHHTGKAATMGGQGDHQGAARGSSAITDGVRWQLNMVGMSEEEAKKFGVRDDERRSYLRVVFAKTNYAAPMEDWWCRRGNGGALEAWYPPIPGGELNFGISGNDKK